MPQVSESRPWAPAKLHRNWSKVCLAAMERILKNQLRGCLSWPVTQPFFRQLVKVCHAGMNYGGGQSPAESGEIGALEFVRRADGSSRQMTLFDVGAHDGEYLSQALQVLGERVKAYSFEPQAISYARLRARFASDSRVELRNAALGKKAGMAELFSEGVGDSTASLHRNTILGQRVSESVQVTTIDEICRQEAIERIDLLKIDSEGHELDVLLGASSAIEANHIPFIQFEFGDPSIFTQYHFFDLWKFLSPRYTVHRILRHGLVEVSSYSTDLEICKIANFFCVRK